MTHSDDALDNLYQAMPANMLKRNTIKLKPEQIAADITAFIQDVPKLPKFFAKDLESKIYDTFLVRARYLHFTVSDDQRTGLYMIDLFSGAVDQITADHDTGWNMFVPKYRRGFAEKVVPTRRGKQQIANDTQTRDELTDELRNGDEGFLRYHRATYAARIGDAIYLADVAKIYQGTLRTNSKGANELETNLMSLGHYDAMDPLARRMFLALINHLARRTMTRFDTVLLEWAVYATKKAKAALKAA